METQGDRAHQNKQWGYGRGEVTPKVAEVLILVGVRRALQLKIEFLFCSKANLQNYSSCEVHVAASFRRKLSGHGAMNLYNFIQ